MTDLTHLTAECERLKGELAQAKTHNAALLEACQAAREWLNRFGEHSPVVFGGEQKLDNKLRSAIALEKGEK